MRGRSATCAPKNCVVCGKEFKPVRSTHVACSRACRVKLSIKTQGERKAAMEWRGRSWDTYFKNLIARKLADRHKVLTSDILIKLLEAQGGKCALTGLELTRVVGQGKVRTNASIDRIQAGGTYALDNIRLVCHVVNEMRRDLTTEDFVEMCRKVVRLADAGGK